MLTGKHVLIVEDEWLLADHIGAIVERAGGTVTGPVANVGEALALLDAEATLPDMATLNIRLQDDVSYPIADRLTALAIPYVFISANQAHSMPERFHTQPLLTKPFTDPQVLSALIALRG